MRRLHLAAAILAAALLSSCGEKPATMEDLTSTEIVFPNSTKIIAETMRENIDLTRGLMFRDSLAQGRGMLFVHTSESNFNAWTYQVKFPIDIIWLDRNHHIVEIVANAPACPSASARECPYYGGHQKAQYALEVNAGVVGKNGLKVGDQLGF